MPTGYPNTPEQKAAAVIRNREQSRIRALKAYADPVKRKIIIDRVRARNFAAFTANGKKQVPKWLITDVRLKCVEMGNDLGSMASILLAMVEVQKLYSAESSEYQWLHPEDMRYRAMSWAKGWRQNSKLRASFTSRYLNPLSSICG